MKRLFITTGLISLVNALVIIRQNPIESDDTLAIISFNQSEDFVETQKKIASLHGFSNIVFVKKQKDIFKVFNLNQFDKLYVTSLTNLYKKCNRHKECYFFDEGPGYAFADVSDCRNVKAYCTTNFLNKFSFAKQVKSIPTLELSKDIFCQVSREISEKFNLHDKLNTSKNILFIGHYICREFGNEKALAFYKKYIDYFINLGYNIYFKAHPRDNDDIVPMLKDDYKLQEKFSVLETTLPVEIYDYNFDLIIGPYSGTLISIPHYREIAAVLLPFKELYLGNTGLNFKKFFAICDEYIPTFAQMEQYFNLSKKEMYEQYFEIINCKPIIQENSRLQEVLDYKPNKILDIIFGIFAIFIKDKNKRVSFKNFARKEFFKKLEKFNNGL